MSPGKISEKVVTDRLAWIEEMVVNHPEMVDRTL